MVKIYVAGRLNSDAVGYIKNVHRMIQYADIIRREGFSVFIPCLDLLCGVVAGDYEYSDYFDNNTPWLEAADAVFVIPGSEDSKGTQAEIIRAWEKGIPVYYSLEELRASNTRPKERTRK